MYTEFWWENLLENDYLKNGEKMGGQHEDRT